MMRPTYSTSRLGKGFELEDHAITDGHGTDYSRTFSPPNVLPLTRAVLHTAGARPNNDGEKVTSVM